MDFEDLKVNLGEHFARFADFIDDTVKWLNLPPELQILDIGTGYATMAIILAYNEFNVITGEPEGDNWFDWQLLAQTAQVDEQIHFQPFNAEDLPFDDEEFDGIFLNGSLHHIEDKKQALNECFPTLKTHGWLVIFEFTPEGVEFLRQEWRNHPDAIDPRDFSEDFALECQVIETAWLNAYIFSKLF